MTFAIRSYHPSDLPSLYRIRLRTGDNGGDASPLYRDPDLLGHYYAAPYAVLEPDLCFVLTGAGMPCGYILGTRDSVVFHSRSEREWFSLLRERYLLPRAKDLSLDAQLIRLLHEGYTVNPDLTAYPAHLHIDLLPEAQGKGWGQTLVHTFLERLQVLTVPAVHLEVGTGNMRAIQFYERVGFHRIKEYEASVTFGMQLSSRYASPPLRYDVQFCGLLNPKRLVQITNGFEHHTKHTAVLQQNDRKIANPPWLVVNQM